MSRRVSWVLLVAGFLLVATPIHAATPDQVDASIKKAVEWLYARQTEGHWEPSPKPDAIIATGAGANVHRTNAGQWTGTTAIAAYALLCAGEKPADPRLAQAIEFLKKNEARGMYALSARCLVWSSIPLDPKIRPIAKKDFDLLLNGMRQAGSAKGMYFYLAPVDRNDAKYDHSVSHLAALGVWSMQDQGFEVPAQYWKLTDAGWRANQFPDGAWAYTKDAKERDYTKPTAAMTAAGVATLFITQEQLYDFNNSRNTATDPNIAKGMAWLGNNWSAVFDKTRQFLNYNREPYTLFGVSRIGLASGYKMLGSVDWYQAGAEHILSIQRPEGLYRSYFTDVESTAMSIMFLTYGRAPIVVNKLEYAATGKDDRANAAWRQRPQDMSNLVRWMGRSLERRLGWQVVNLSMPASDLHEGQVLYLSGDHAFEFSKDDVDKLRSYVEKGGLIVGNANGGAEPFNQSFIKLGRAMFPDYEFGVLPEKHPIFTNQQFTQFKVRPQLTGLNNGVRELMILPKLDMGRAFQMADTVGKGEQYQLWSNIVLYAGDKTFRPKGKPHLLPDAAVTGTTKSAKVARLQYAGNWNPEPAGWPRLASRMAGEDKVRLEYETVVLGEGKLSGQSVAHLTGTVGFNLSDKQRQEIKAYVEGGGTLLIDAAGGSTAFATAAETELIAIFGAEVAKELATPLPPDARLYTSNKIDAVAYRPFARQAHVGSVKTPLLRGVQRNGRYVVYFSREDLSAGLVGQNIDGIVGYAPEIATAITAAVISSCAK